MIKKGFIIVSMIASMALAGCAPQHEAPPEKHKAYSSHYQSGYSSKLGKTGR